MSRLIAIMLCLAAAGCTSVPTQPGETPYQNHSDVLIDEDTGLPVPAPTGGE